jgi:two-component system response regulator FimZ (fimbrial Z protein)
MKKDFNLTARESEILFLISQALSRKRIAERLAISNRTVDSHIRNMHQKCNTHSVVELILLLNK